MKRTTATHSPRRRAVVGAACAVFALGSVQPLRAETAAAWQHDVPESLGVASDLSARLDEGVRSGELTNLHAVFVARRGKRALERYYAGTDDKWGTPLGRVAFDAATLHDLRSVSKSLVGLLYGIALSEGKVPALDTPVLDAFPAYPDLARDARRRAIRMSHVLSMTMGLDWNEDLPYTDPRNSEIAMERSADRYRYVLEREVVASPGLKWTYGGGATAILGHLIARGTGMSLLQFARARLFAPLGIEEVEWTPGLNGEEAAASGLRLRACDLARVGQMVLQSGEWNGRAVVPREWIAASLTPRADAFEGVQYGYQWYLPRRRDGAPACMGIGLGGQRLVVVPSLELVYVIFMGNYNRAFPEQIRAVSAVQTLIHSSLR
ncbi:MAG: class C beta-lactamase-related serine hydrolase [Comamonadaceae bacterium]|nr:MAG: class C beta-lactamase-related serine hydrolase [Comamonadaceae bacterium]